MAAAYRKNAGFARDALGGGLVVARQQRDIQPKGEKLLNGLARRTLTVMKLNLFWAFVYNVAALGIAAAGVLAPQWAAVAMVISSLCVVGNSWQLRDFERNVKHEAEAAPATESAR